VIETASNTVIATFAVGSEILDTPQGIAITPDGSRAYVTHLDSGIVSVIDTVSNTVIATISVGSGSGPHAVAITPDGTRAYVTNVFGNTVSVIDPMSNMVIATVPVACPTGIAITPAPLSPTTKYECKDGGYRKFGPPAGPFKNQGQCVKYVNEHAHN
jgi:YVTN family beta-propeller protein